MFSFLSCRIEHLRLKLHVDVNVNVASANRSIISKIWRDIPTNLAQSNGLCCTTVLRVKATHSGAQIVAAKALNYLAPCTVNEVRVDQVRVVKHRRLQIKMPPQTNNK